ncbi:MIP/aquaporin family protein [Parendozoicomonas haliclonae]|uniref:Glycerol uptake facilitator protein n=1 Tax=Parendozoicomonas haliclonae TaxID=1960125 RepID=A0A1X7ALA6_9GAMM|nr:MIP/aquaporin family protein [Parendozoicomonas haliclonae]SMA48298.1 Glycerol uptake facilitator protein [Parendozoicomonas haliclonae]
MNRSTLAGECLAEFIGTALIIIFGAGVVSALVLAGASFGQWEISVVWGLGVSIAIYVSGGVSGAHLNPAVTIALSIFKGFEKAKIVPFIVSQVAGAFTGALLVYTMYQPLFAEFHAANGATLATAGIFSTYPMAVLSNGHAFLIEVFITALLMGCILALGDNRNGAPKGAMSALLIGLLIAVIGCSFGPLTGFAMNPARDFGPKLFALVADWGSLAMTGGRENPYFWVPILGPIVGASLGAFIYTRCIEKQLDLKELSCGAPGCEIDTRAPEQKLDATACGAPGCEVDTRESKTA